MKSRKRFLERAEKIRPLRWSELAVAGPIAPETRHAVESAIDAAKQPGPWEKTQRGPGTTILPFEATFKNQKS